MAGINDTDLSPKDLAGATVRDVSWREGVRRCRVEGEEALKVGYDRSLTLTLETRAGKSVILIVDLDKTTVFVPDYLRTAIETDRPATFEKRPDVTEFRNIALEHGIKAAARNIEARVRAALDEDAEEEKKNG